MTERVHHNLRPKNVVTQPVFAPSDAPLPLAKLEAGEFLDRMPAGSVMWIFGEDGHQIFQGLHHDLIAFRGLPEFPLERRSCQDPELRTHRGRLFSCFGSFRPKFS